MKRREFITLIGGAAAAWPLTARAQQLGRTRRLGILMALPENDSEARPRVSALKERLEQLGWIGGKNLHMEFRWAEDLSRIGTYAAELAGLTPDVILTTSTPTTKAVQQTTTTTPIVFVGVSDPMSTGIVASLAKPGGNTTGFANYEFAIGGKWLELLKEIAPHVKQAHVIVDPNNPTGSWHLQTIESAALAVGIAVTTVVVRNKDEIGPAFATFSKEREKGLIVLPGPITNAHRNEIIASAMAHRIPASTRFGSTPSKAAWSPTGWTPATNTDARRSTSTAYSRVRNRPTFRCRRRQRTKL